MSYNPCTRYFRRIVLARPMFLRFGPVAFSLAEAGSAVESFFPFPLLVSLATFLSRAVSGQCCSARSPEAPSAGRRRPLGGPALLIAMVPSVPDDAVDNSARSTSGSYRSLSGTESSRIARASRIRPARRVCDWSDAMASLLPHAG